MPAARTDDASARRRARALRIAGLYAVTPDLASTEELAARAAAALTGGAAAIQYRNKAADPALKREQARALARVQAIRGGLFIVNDDAALAAEVCADGVHIGSDDLGIDAARDIVGPDRIIGVSCYDDLALAEGTSDVTDVAIARVELLEPVPVDEIARVFERYPEAHEVFWVQEEPENMGAWEHLRRRVAGLLPDSTSLDYIGRPRRASPSCCSRSTLTTLPARPSPTPSRPCSPRARTTPGSRRS